MVNPCLAGCLTGPLATGSCCCCCCCGCGVGTRGALGGGAFSSARSLALCSNSLSLCLSLLKSRSLSRSLSRSCNSRRTLDGPGEPSRLLYDDNIKGGGGGRAAGGFGWPELLVTVDDFWCTCRRSRRICNCGRGGRAWRLLGGPEYPELPGTDDEDACPEVVVEEVDELDCGQELDGLAAANENRARGPSAPGSSSAGLLSSSWRSASSNASGGTSPTACVNACRRRSQFLRKTLPHDVHSYGLWSVWVNKCVFRLLRWLKLRAQTGHLCGDSSMWSILCTARVRLWQKPFPHSPHLNGFSLLWMYLRDKQFG